jgi:hypothetical protein
MEDEAAGLVDICVEDESNRVLCEGVFVTGLSADALARVRAAVAAAGEGASPDEVARIASGTLLIVLGSVASHPDQPRLHGEQPALDYGELPWP